MSAEPVIHFQIKAPTVADIRAFADEVQPDFGCRAIPRRTEEGFVIDAYLPEPQLQAVQRLRSANRVTLSVIENMTEVGRERQQEVGQGDRFAANNESDLRSLRGPQGLQIPQGLGQKE